MLGVMSGIIAPLSEANLSIASSPAAIVMKAIGIGRHKVFCIVHQRLQVIAELPFPTIWGLDISLSRKAPGGTIKKMVGEPFDVAGKFSEVVMRRQPLVEPAHSSREQAQHDRLPLIGSDKTSDQFCHLRAVSSYCGAYPALRK